MNIMEDTVVTKNSSNKTTKILVILMIITVLISIGIIGAIYYLKIKEFKFLFNGSEYKKYTNDLFVINNDKIYISIKDMASLVDYKAYNGTFGSQDQYSEDTTKCYVEGKNELASFELNSNIISKTLISSNDGYEYFEIDEPVVQINNKLYTTQMGISKALNIVFDYNKNSNEVSVYTLPYLVDYYTKTVQNVDLTNFNNQKALLYNLLIVSDGMESSDVKYGVNTLDGKEIVGTKYKNIEFIEASQEFIVTTTNDKVGIITISGTTKIQPQYDVLKQIDKKLNLYLVENYNKKGIIDENGKTIIYTEYDRIGINIQNFAFNNIENPYILYNNCIPVYKNGKWGIYDKTGKTILPIEYDNLGYIINKNDEISANSTLIIPEIKGIVVCKKKLNVATSETITLYGVVNYQGKTIIPIVLSSIYSVRNSGKDEYYMINAGNKINVIDWVNENIKIEEINVE